jgi:hypothetical protein
MNNPQAIDFTTGKSALQLRINPNSYLSTRRAASPYHDPARSIMPST